MKVLLKEDVDNLGYSGEVHDVADGYGRNYLIPRELAVRATPGVLKQAAAWRAKAEARRAQIRAENEALADKIVETHLVFTAKAGETGKLYGSITMDDVAAALENELGAEIDRRNFDSRPLRDLGEHKVTVNLSRDFKPQLTIFIHPESGEDTEEEEGTETEATEAEAAEHEAAADVSEEEPTVVAETG